MTTTPSADFHSNDVADVLVAMAELMSNFREHDLALQDALSSISARARSTPEMGNLQHVDLITQTHGDLAKLLPKLASILDGETIDRDTLKDALTLRSLKDTLIDRAEASDTVSGELSLF